MCPNSDKSNRLNRGHPIRPIALCLLTNQLASTQVVTRPFIYIYIYIKASTQAITQSFINENNPFAFEWGEII